jgi:hypothetical protein
MTNIRRLLTEARKLVATMDPQPGHPLDGVDAMIHAALMEIESNERSAAAHLGRLSAQASQAVADVLRESKIELG